MNDRFHFSRWLALRALGFLAALTFARLTLILWFARDTPLVALGEALILGLRFDARLIAGLTLAALPFCAFKKTSPAASNRNTRRIWIIADSTLTLILALFIISDFAHFSYLKERLNAGVITLAKDTRDAIEMVWQSYPVIWISAGVLAFGIIVVRILKKLGAGAKTVPMSNTAYGLHILGTVLVCVIAIFGRIGQYPLRWSESANITPAIAGAMSLNPVLHFFDTMAFAAKGYKNGDDDPYRAAIAARLGVTSPMTTPYERIQKGRENGIPRDRNVVLVILESCSGYKSSVFGNPLNPTPVLKRLADNGLLFERHFTAHPGTARGVFTLNTGVPDVQLGDTASRNPRAAKHRFILEDYGFAEKHYFIGGSTRWANVRGVLKATMPDIKIHEEDGLSGPRTDVWGVADGDLLPEAAISLGHAKKPFFAVIQTASNHRPYTIPEAHLRDCPRNTFDKATLASAGFESPEEWDGMHYMDWSVGRLIEEAKRAGWHDDTVFVFVGDHGICGTPGGHMPAIFANHAAFTQGHTPLIYYAPGTIAPGRVSTPCMQADVLPTLAGLFNGDFTLRCLGRDASKPTADASPALTFMINHSAGPIIGVFDGRYYATTGIKPKDPVKLYDGESSVIDRDIAGEKPDLAARLGKMAKAHYHVAARMLTHNGGTVAEAPLNSKTAP